MENKTINYFKHYIGCNCILVEENQNKGYLNTLEGVDKTNNSIISERVNWKPEQVKLILKTIDDLTTKDFSYILKQASGYLLDDSLEEIEKNIVIRISDKYIDFNYRSYYFSIFKSFLIEDNNTVFEDGISPYVDNYINIVKYLIDNNFDVFGLIEKGLAVSSDDAKNYLINLD